MTPPRDVVAVVNPRSGHVAAQTRTMVAWSASVDRPIIRTVSPAPEELAQACEDCRQTAAAGIVVTRLDVLGDLVDQEVALSAVRAVDGAVFVVDERDATELETPGEEARVLLRMYDERRAALGDHVLAARLHRGFRKAASERGRVGGRTAYGYRMVAGQIIEDAAEMAIVARVGDLWDQGQGYSAIGRQLKVEGYRKRNGSPEWHPDAVRRIVKRIEEERRRAAAS